MTIRIQKNADAALQKMGERFAKAWKTGKSTGDSLEFESPAALFRVLTPKRWELIERLQELGPSSVQGLARKLERDVKRVQEDVGVLIECGLACSALVYGGSVGATCWAASTYSVNSG